MYDMIFFFQILFLSQNFFRDDDDDGRRCCSLADGVFLFVGIDFCFSPSSRIRFNIIILKIIIIIFSLSSLSS